VARVSLFVIPLLHPVGITTGRLLITIVTGRGICTIGITGKVLRITARLASFVLTLGLGCIAVVVGLPSLWDEILVIVGGPLVCLAVLPKMILMSQDATDSVFVARGVAFLAVVIVVVWLV
jgi:hypothetical protein